MGVRIVTDSAADLPADIVEKYNIQIVPLSIHFGDEQYRDGVDMTAQEFYRRLRSETRLPRTSQPSPGEFIAVYKEAVAAGDKVVSIHLSGQLSGTYQAASLAARMAGSENVIVLDSLSASMGVGLQVVAAARQVARGEKDPTVIASAAQRVRDHLGVLFIVDTLEYLEKNGRIGKAAALFGNMLQIKPILTLDNGGVAPLEKVRGKKKALHRVLELLSERIGSQDVIDVAVVHADVFDQGQALLDEVCQRFSCRYRYLSDIGPTIGVHVGPGTVAVLWHKIAETE